MTIPTEGTAAAVQEQPKRRVGTFTLGVSLLCGGGVMLAATVFPDLDFSWTLKLCPLILICLGVETLIAAAGGRRIRYDWAGILLSFLLACAALGLFAASWGLARWVEYGDYYEGASLGNQSSLILDYSRFNSTRRQDLNLKAGDVLECRVVKEAGSVSAYILSEAGVLYQGRDLLTGSFTVEAPEDGSYEVCVTGRQAAGSFTLQKTGEPAAES